ncbi:MAG TPA: helix-turn-helix domain-containing protein [Dehalococcoidia bacterium]|nr:helix-turn-helix domain-containing protein [Dehalococcoidia bacterium]
MATNHNLPSPPPPKAFYTIEEVAELLGLHRATVSHYISSGQLRAARLGHRTVRITHEAVLDFLRTKEAETQASIRQGNKRRGKAKS